MGCVKIFKCFLLNSRMPKRRKVKRGVKKVVKRGVRRTAAKATKKHTVTRERISSGSKGFDKLIGKGFPRNSINVVVGGAGSGKTVFGTQFLVEGAKRGEPGVFVTFEEKKDRFYGDMRSLGFNLEELEKKKKFAFIEYTPEQVKKMLEEGGGEIEIVIEEIKAKRVVIDSITSFTLLFESEIEKREASLALFEMLRKWEVTTLLTLEQEAALKLTVDHIASPLEFEVDGIILLYFVRPDGKRLREIEILKIRGTEHSKEIFNFKIGRGGISITGKGKFARLRSI